MKLIDFHTHIFPDAVAPKAIEALVNRSHLTPRSDGTLQGLLKTMAVDGVDTSVIVPVITKASQYESINRFAVKLNLEHKEDGKLISFGAVYPDDPDMEAHLINIRDMGLKGIKIHPYYHNMPVNDIRIKRVMDKASELGLIMVCHAGADPGFPGIDFCNVGMILDVLKDVKPVNLVLAHMGASRLWTDVEKYLCGADVYFDTANVAGVIGTDQCARIISKHGAEKILFATDCPWNGAKQTREVIDACGLAEEDLNKIYHANAEKLLGRAETMS